MAIASSLGHLFLSGIFISGGAQAFIEPDGRVNKVAVSGLQEPWPAWWTFACADRKIVAY